MKTYTYNSFGTSYEVWLEKGKYANGRIALSLMSNEGPVATATVNLPEQALKPGEVFIKTWSENEGMLDFLLENKLVEYTGEEIPTGYVSASVCKLLI